MTNRAILVRRLNDATEQLADVRQKKQTVALEAARGGEAAREQFKRLQGEEADLTSQVEMYHCAVEEFDALARRQEADKLRERRLNENARRAKVREGMYNEQAPQHAFTRDRFKAEGNHEQAKLWQTALDKLPETIYRQLPDLPLEEKLADTFILGAPDRNAAA